MELFQELDDENLSFAKIDSLKRTLKTIEDDEDWAVESSSESSIKKQKLVRRKGDKQQQPSEYSRQKQKRQKVGPVSSSGKIIDHVRTSSEKTTKTSYSSITTISSSCSSSSNSRTTNESRSYNRASEDLNATESEKIIIDCQAENRNNEICHHHSLGFSIAEAAAAAASAVQNETQGKSEITGTAVETFDQSGSVSVLAKTVKTSKSSSNHHNIGITKITHNRAAAAAGGEEVESQKSNAAAKIARNIFLDNKGQNFEENISKKRNKEKNQRSKLRSVDEEVHYRYRQYLNLEPQLKDQYKTDYTYAHSFSYSPLVPPKEKYSWTVPNMSRQSIRHQYSSVEKSEHTSATGNDLNDSILDEASVSRRIVNNVPLSRITKSTMNTRQRTASVLHSTPMVVAKSGTTTAIAGNSNAKADMLEFSDDDEDEMNNTVRIIGYSPQKNAATYNATKKTATTATYSQSHGQFSDDDDEEDLTIIRRIKRYFITTIRNFGAFVPVVTVGGQDSFATDSDNGNHVPSSTSTSRVHHERNQRSQYSGNLRQRGQPFPLTTTITSNDSSWFTNDGDQFDQELNDGGKSRFWRRWPCWLCLFFLLIFPLLLALSYYLYGGGAFIGNFLHLSDESNRKTDPGSSMMLPTFSLLAWPGWLFSSEHASSSSLSGSSWWPQWSWWNVNPSSGSSEPSASNHQDMSHLTSEIFALKQELLSLKRKTEEERNVRNAETTSQTAPPMVTSPDIDELLDRIGQLELKLATCCRANWTEHLENHVRMVVDTKLNDMQRKYEAQLEREMDNLRSHLMRFVEEHSASLNRSITGQMAQFDIGRGPATEGSDLGEMQRLIQLALAKYDADKTGEADFALESSGAMVVSTRCSESYEIYSASYQLLGWTVWRSSCSPRVVFQRGAVPGECWCFKGSEGRIAVKLSARIIPTAVSYEHIPLALSRDGHIRSAPQRFLVYGLRSVDDEQPVLLGEYHYEIPADKMDLLHPPALQRFTVQNTEAARHTFQIIEFAIQSNHGHPDYTCLYRLRVHGELPAAATLP